MLAVSRSTAGLRARGADPASHPFYSAAGQAVGCTALSSLALGLQASRGPGSRNRGD